MPNTMKEKAARIQQAAAPVNYWIIDLLLLEGESPYLVKSFGQSFYSKQESAALTHPQS